MDDANIQKLVEISKMYYEQNMTQEGIAKVFKMSRSAVSMALTEAKSLGIINIQIKDPSVNNAELAASLEQYFGLKKCIVVPSGTHDEEALLRVMTSQAVRLAAELFRSHSSIGVAWGNTLYEFMRNFPNETTLCDVTVVPLVGTSPLLTHEFQLNESIRMFADKLRGYPIFIYSPGLVDTMEDRESIVNSSYMQPILDLWQHLDYAVIGIGRSTDREGKRKFFTNCQSMLDEVCRCPEMAIGDICARRINIRGEFIDNDFNRKLIGITADNLLNAKNVLAMAVGSSKVLAIIAALRTKTIHYFVTDENTAQQVMNLIENYQLPE